MCEKCSLDQLHPTAPSRRSLVLFAASALGGLMLADTANAKDTKAPPKPQNVLSPDAALKKLMEGNARYVDGTARRHDFKHEREALAGGQNPYAAILSCADSRIAPEYAFDSGRVTCSFAAWPAISPTTIRLQAWNMPSPCLARR